MLLRVRVVLVMSMIFIVILGCASSEPSPAAAQVDATATPFSPIIIQGFPNEGNVQPFAMSEVAIRTGIRAWQDAGWSGRGIRVGVLDRGFGHLFDFEQTSGQSVTVALGDDKSEYNEGQLNHGTQVLETIFAVAPNAELFACQYDNLDKFTLCIDWMISSGVRIINHSAGVPALPLDGSSRWSRQVDRAAQADVVWVNSAGNFAQGYYTDVFTDNDRNNLHEFRGMEGNPEALGVEALASSEDGIIMLSWQGLDVHPANAIDIDLQIIDANTGQVLARSNRTQSGRAGDEALEYVVIEMTRRFAVQIIDNNSRAPGVRFSLFVEFAQLPAGETQRSIIAPGDSVNALTVGALQGSSIAPYSSRGPLATGAIKPDLTAPGEVELFDGTRFVGTSAAAPIVAGSAALIWEANPGYNARDVRTYLVNATQDDDQILGNDIIYGNGRLYVPQPLATAVVVETPEPTQTQPPPGPTLTLSSTPEPTITPEIRREGPFLTVAVDSANLRGGPGTNYNVLGSAQGGTILDVVAVAHMSDGDWYLIERENGGTAWIWSGITILTSDMSIVVAATIPAPPLSSPIQSTATPPRTGL